MAKQLAFEEILGESYTIDSDKRLMLSFAPVMDGRAKTSFPAPLSPRSKTVDLLEAAFLAVSIAARIAGCHHQLNGNAGSPLR